jgi:hypothetical protein
MDEFPFDLLNHEHRRIMEAANQNQVTMRLLGRWPLSCAVRAKPLCAKTSVALSRTWTIPPSQNSGSR